MEDKVKKVIEVIIRFDTDKEEVIDIESDFMNEKYNFKSPIEYTARLIQMALEKWIRDKIGIVCPECDNEFKEGWKFCPNCGWNPDEE